MKKILDIKPGDWLTVEQVAEVFPWITASTISNWRYQENKGFEPVGTYPHSKVVANRTVVYKPSLLEWLSKSDSKAS